MKLKFTYLRAGGDAVDLVATVDATVTVGDLATAVAKRDPGSPGRKNVSRPGEQYSLRVHAGHASGPATVLSAGLPLTASSLRSGCYLSLAQVTERWQQPGSDSGPAAATLKVLSGPDTGKNFPLRDGTTYLGRDPSCDVVLKDTLVSKRHAQITVTEVVEIVDLGSANGLVLGGQPVSRAVVRPDDRILVGDTFLAITLHRTQAASLLATTDVDFNRSPRLDPSYPGTVFPAPEPPEQPRPDRFPVLAMLAPLLMGAILYVFTRSLLSIVFVALSPLLMAGQLLDNRFQLRRSGRQAQREFDEALHALRQEVADAQQGERLGRLAEAPSTTELMDAVGRLTGLLWTRRREHERFLLLRLGVGADASRHSIELPSRGRASARDWARLVALQNDFRLTAGVPIVAALPVAGSIGIAGRLDVASGVARGVVLQLAGLHSPADLTIAALASNEVTAEWDWLKWLPHCGSPYSPLVGTHLAGEAAAGTRLLAELEELIAARDPAKIDGYRRILVVVDDNAPVERARVVGIAEEGPAVGIHLLWVGTTQDQLPAACRAFVVVDPTSGTVAAGFVQTALGYAPIECESVSAAAALATAKALAPVSDAGVRVADDSDLPQSVSFLNLIGTELAERPATVVERWRESESIVDRTGSTRTRRRNNGLRAVIGQAAGAPLILDLRSQGPHALVGGTTGAGKSEFLQSWVLGMASGYSPDLLNFLFVDYKGGAAFADCVRLPHTVGLVTDLSPHLVRRALTSLNAELRYREHILNRKKAKDLLELQRRGDPDAPPSLVIVVDEFAALVQEVPEFVDGVVNVAQRGRSLGLHLILATQRPAGVIKDNLRANTNLRVALRMADPNDSVDVLESPVAADFSPDIPGRGAAKTGPGRITGFQTGYVGGWTSDDEGPVTIGLHQLQFGVGKAWDEPESDGAAQTADLGPTDIARLVDSLASAAHLADLPAPRKPWLPDLASNYDLELLSQRRDRELTLGVVDDPAEQSQRPGYFEPDTDGNMAIYGTGGAGKSTALRTLAIAAGITPRSGPCQVYGLDFGSSALRMLEPLPHVGSIISGDDDERISRLIRWLKSIVDERAERYAAMKAGNITQYRELSKKSDEPRILLLVDGFAAFRQQYESLSVASVFTQFTQVASDGRPVGVHVVITADRAASVPSSLRAAIQRTLVLRMADPGDYGALGVPVDALGGDSPPGRGLLDGADMQVCTLGGTASLVMQSRAVERLAATMQGLSAVRAPAIQSLPTRVLMDDLGPSRIGLPIGIAADTLRSREIAPSGFWIIAGPPGSPTVDVLAGVAESMRRNRPGTPRVLVVGGTTALDASLPWTAVLRTSEELEKWRAEAAAGREVALFIEQAAGLVDGPLEAGVQTLAQAVGRGKGVVFAESETERWRQYSDLLKMLRSSRRGLLVEPDQADGDSLLNTELPRVRRRDFALCGGLVVENGGAGKVQFVEAG